MRRRRSSSSGSSEGSRKSNSRPRKRKSPNSMSQVIDQEGNEYQAVVPAQNIIPESSDTSDFEEVTIEGTTSSLVEEASQSSSGCNPVEEGLPTVYMCTSCGIYFPHWRMLRNHTDTIHPSVNASVTPSQPIHRCKKCNFVTEDEAMLTRHVALKHHLSQLLGVERRSSMTIKLQPVKLPTPSPEPSPPPSPNEDTHESQEVETEVKVTTPVSLDGLENVENEDVEQVIEEELVTTDAIGVVSLPSKTVESQQDLEVVEELTVEEMKIELPKIEEAERDMITNEWNDHEYTHRQSLLGLSDQKEGDEEYEDHESSERSPSFSEPSRNSEYESIMKEPSPVASAEQLLEEIVTDGIMVDEGQQVHLELGEDEMVETEMLTEKNLFHQVMLLELPTLEHPQPDLQQQIQLEKTLVPDSIDPTKLGKARRSTRKRKSNVQLSCQSCEFVSNDREVMQLHSRNEHNTEWVKDRKKYEFKTKQNYDAEDLTHPCYLCEYKARSRTSINAHIRRKHPTERRRRVKQTTRGSATLECADCDFTTRYRFKLELHIERKHTLEPRHECDKCGKKYKTKIDLTAHIKFFHQNNFVICDVCGEVCKNSNSLITHKKRIHCVPQFKCPHCPRRMVTQENLDQHIDRQHLRKVRPTCDYCGKDYDQQNKLIEHVRTHTGEKPFPCNVCGRKFGRRSVLRQHMLTHAGVKPYVCNVCGKGFAQKPGLICHRKVHPDSTEPLPVVYVSEIVERVKQQASSITHKKGDSIVDENNEIPVPDIHDENMQDEADVQIDPGEEVDFDMLSLAEEQHDVLGSLQFADEIIEECSEEIVNDITL